MCFYCFISLTNPHFHHRLLLFRAAWTIPSTPAWYSLSNDDRNDGADLSAYIREQVRAVTHSLYHLQPSWCHFEGVQCGNIPGDASYANVESISLPHLGLSGTLPDSIGNFRCLTHFDVSHNHLRGTIPASMSNWHSGVRELLMSHNMFTGAIPPFIGTRYARADLTLDWNSLAGTIPCTISDMTSQTRQRLETNFLTETIPMQMSQLSHLKPPDNCEALAPMGSLHAKDPAPRCPARNTPPSRKCRWKKRIINVVENVKFQVNTAN